MSWGGVGWGEVEWGGVPFRRAALRLGWCRVLWFVLAGARGGLVCLHVVLWGYGVAEFFALH